MDEKSDPTLEHLKWALQALAAPAEEQIRLFPSFVCIPDELVLDFDCWYQSAKTKVSFSLEQQDALSELDDCIQRWSGPPNQDVWHEAALATHPVWLDFRALAKQALAAFSWSMDLPPFERGNIYVQN